ncbi:hypothetical protein CEQ90_16460 [Lewinellaceae bacterium SD302]|nr:hypothetical protein CEQ90_16460 [Lewinellaceae bacterium SD302]
MSAAANLKAKTAAAHHRAESALDASAIRRGNYSVSAYRKLIRANHAIWGAAINWMESHFSPEAIRADYDFVAALHAALEKDLELLEVSPLPTRHLPFEGAGQAELLGLLYVLRGSTLGGTMIARMLPASPELTNLETFNFYRACGNQPAGHWKVFQTRLNEALSKEGELTKATTAAITVLDQLHDCMAIH